MRSSNQPESLVVSRIARLAGNTKHRETRPLLLADDASIALQVAATLPHFHVRRKNRVASRTSGVVDEQERI